MRAERRAGFALLLGTIVVSSSSVFLQPAHATTIKDEIRHTRHVHVAGALHADQRRWGHARYTRVGLQCVPFARAASGIELSGNAVNWWDAAARVYERGSQPETGAVLNFRATGAMRLGHVAVVTTVLSPREIEIDHANWSHYGGGNISRAARVVDISPENDWSAVRVELGHTGSFGAVYPTYGFIYDRPDSGSMTGNTLVEQHPTAERPALDADEVAEAPAGAAPQAAPGLLLVDAPDRRLR